MDQPFPGKSFTSFFQVEVWISWNNVGAQRIELSLIVDDVSTKERIQGFRIQIHRRIAIRSRSGVVTDQLALAEFPAWTQNYKTFLLL